MSSLSPSSLHVLHFIIIIALWVAHIILYNLLKTDKWFTLHIPYYYYYYFIVLLILFALSNDHVRMDTFRGGNSPNDSTGGHFTACLACPSWLWVSLEMERCMFCMLYVVLLYVIQYRMIFARFQIISIELTLLAGWVPKDLHHSSLPHSKQHTIIHVDAIDFVVSRILDTDTISDRQDLPFKY